MQATFRKEKIGEFGKLFSFSLLLFLISASFASSSENRHYIFEGKPVDDRTTDLTSQYLDVHFSGIINTENSQDKCQYVIPRLTVRLLKIKNRLTKSIKIDGLKIVAANYGSNFTMVRLLPYTKFLPYQKSSINIENIKFSISKDILKKSDYVGLALSGTILFQDDGRFAYADAQTRTRLFIQGMHTIWPISPANKKFQDLGEFDFRVIRRPPQNPNDLCSSAKLM